MTPSTPPGRVTLERTYEDATLEDVWDLWTTRDGIESWWGPEGFRVQVDRIDVRPGGELHYRMIAVAPEMVAFMKQHGMPVAQPCRITFTEVVPRRRLAYLNLVDFVPGHPSYQTAHELELRASGSAVRLTLTLERMHDEEWTKRAVMGWEMELGKLGRALAAHVAARDGEPG